MLPFDSKSKPNLIFIINFQGGSAREVETIQRCESEFIPSFKPVRVLNAKPSGRNAGENGVDCHGVRVSKE